MGIDAFFLSLHGKRIAFHFLPSMSTPYFDFKQFRVWHDQCAHRVGTDGVLLGAWAKGGKKILDIGTGSGLIALMMAQRFPDAQIDAVEQDETSAEQAEKNFAKSPFHCRIKLINQRIQDFKSTNNYDCIVCNPPYFSETVLGNDGRRMNARHCSALPFNELFACINSKITPNGTFSVILPASQLTEFITEAFHFQLSLIKRTNISSFQRRQPKRCLLCFARTSEEIHIENVYLNQSDGKRSEWYKSLTEDFYIK